MNIQLEPQEVDLLLQLLNRKLEKVNQKEVSQDQLIFKKELEDLISKLSN